MWTMLLILWSVPLAAAGLILARMWEGRSAITKNESELFFGEAKPITLSLRIALEFAAIALLFFMLGIFEGLVLPNFGSAWAVVVPLMTSVGALAILAYRLRSAPLEKRTPRGKHAWATAAEERIVDLLHTLNFHNRR
jgi:hypothetical protein